MTETATERRHLLRLGGAGLALAAAGAALDPSRAAAQAASTSLLRTVLDRGKLIVGTGSTNPPWHFEDDQGKLTGMDIAMARILAKGLFADETKVEYVQQDPNARIPNITTGKVDIVIQFMTVSSARAQLVAFSRPYYVEGAALLTAPKSKWQTYKDMLAAGKQVRASVLQNVGADDLVHQALPDAQSMQLDTQANVMQAVVAGRADVGVVDASTVKWLVKHNPGDLHRSRLCLRGAALLRRAAAGRSRLAALRGYLLQRRHARQRAGNLHRGIPGILRREAAGAETRLPADLIARPRHDTAPAGHRAQPAWQ